jgi:methyl acetate hydrolase
VRTVTLTRRLQERLDALVAEGHVPGVVGVLADRSGVVFEGAAGVRDTGTGDPMTVDTEFRIASMTKLMTAVAVLQLVDRGRLDLDAPVASLVPEFGTLQVLDGFRDEQPVLRPPRTAATVRQLLTHTSGLGYAAWHADLQRFHEVTGARELACAKRAAFLEVPLAAEPGTVFQYSTSLDWAGLVVEAASGRTLDAYWREEIFEPLAMHRTFVLLDDETRPRTAAVHLRSENGDGWTATAIDYYAPGSDPPEFFAGGHCLYSTAGDCLRLQRALLAGGALDGVQVLGEETAAAMFRDHLRPLAIPRFPAVKPAVTVEVDLGPGASWALGQMLTTARQAGLRHAGSGGWTGLFNTTYWIDPQAGLAGGFYVATLPFYEGRVMAAEREFEQTCYAALDG